MAGDAEIGLARIAVMAPNRRVDLALPEHAPLASLLPSVLEHAGVADAPDERGGHGGWLLRRSDGTPLDVARGATAQGVRDGDVLYLVRANVDWPEPEHDDVVDAIAAGARQGGVLWGARITHWAGAGIAGGLVATALAAIVLRGPEWTLPAVLCLLLAAGCLAAGAILTHALGLPGIGYALAAYSLPAAFTGGLVLWGGGNALAALGAPHLLTGCSALLLAALLGHVSTSISRWLFGAAATAAVLVGVAAAVTIAPPGPRQTSAGLVAVVMLLLPIWPMAAARLGRIPLPDVPRSAADLASDEPAAPTSVTVAAVRRGDRILTGLLAGSCASLAAGMVVLAGSGGGDAYALVTVAALACLVRARLFPTLRHRLPLLLCGVTGLAALAVAWPAAVAGERALWAVPVLALLAIATLAIAIRYARTRPSIYLSRTADIVEILLMLAVVPLACGPLGIYGYMRGVAG